MSNLARLRARLSAQPSETLVKGQWRPISACLDEDSGEFLNVGVLFAYGAGKVEVRMLDTFDRIACLYDDRIDLNDLSHLMHDIEDSIVHAGHDLPDALSDTICLGAPLFASGASPEAVVDEFFEDVVTLGRPRNKQRSSAFRYRSSHKIREALFDIMQQRMALEASSIIQEGRYLLKLQSGHRIEVDVPLLSDKSAGSVVSAWYKSPLVVENNLLQASADLLLVTSNTGRKGMLSVLTPGKDNGLSVREFNKHHEATHRQLDRIHKSGIDIVEAGSTDELACKTMDWWRAAS